MENSTIDAVIARWVSLIPLWGWLLIIVAIVILFLLSRPDVKKAEKAQPSAPKDDRADPDKWSEAAEKAWSHVPHETRRKIEAAYDTASDLLISRVTAIILAGLGAVGAPIVTPAEMPRLTQVSSPVLPGGCVIAGVEFSAMDIATSTEADVAEKPAPAGAATAPTDIEIKPVDDAVALYFDPGSVNLGVGSRRRLSATIQKLRQDPALAVAITGFADSVGNDGINQLIGFCRATAVAHELAHAGITLDRVWILSMGESQPAIQTGDEISEPLNRRAEVKIR